MRSLSRCGALAARKMFYLHPNFGAGAWHSISSLMKTRLVPDSFRREYDEEGGQRPVGFNESSFELLFPCPVQPN